MSHHSPRPLIGISGGTTDVPIIEGTLRSTYAGRGYSERVEAAGGRPVVLPAPARDAEGAARELIARLDGVVLAGGVDLDPAVYDAAWPPAQPPDRDRDHFELALARAAVESDTPLLGICRGMQVLNVAFGGTLHEHVVHADIAGSDEKGLRDVRRHELGVAPGSRLRDVFGRDRISVFCLHHQSPDRIGEGLLVSARADDGIVEAIETEGGGFALGVLWHPEQMDEGDEFRSLPFEALLASVLAEVDA